MASTVPNSEATQFKAGAKQVEIARKGGIASGEAKRLKKTMKQAIIETLESTNSKGVSYQDLVNLGLIKGAINGNANNYKMIVEMIGELSENKAETPQVNINIIDNSNLESAMYEEDET